MVEYFLYENILIFQVWHFSSLYISHLPNFNIIFTWQKREFLGLHTLFLHFYQIFNFFYLLLRNKTSAIFLLKKHKNKILFIRKNFYFFSYWVSGFITNFFFIHWHKFYAYGTQVRKKKPVILINLLANKIAHLEAKKDQLPTVSFFGDSLYRIFGKRLQRDIQYFYLSFFMNIFIIIFYNIR